MGGGSLGVLAFGGEGLSVCMSLDMYVRGFVCVAAVCALLYVAGTKSGGKKEWGDGVRDVGEGEVASGRFAEH